MYLELEDYVFLCGSKGLSPQTIKTYRDNIRLFLETAEKEYKVSTLRDVQKQHIKDYLRLKKDMNVVISILIAFTNH